MAHRGVLIEVTVGAGLLVKEDGPGGETRGISGANLGLQGSGTEGSSLRRAVRVLPPAQKGCGWVEKFHSGPLMLMECEQP